MGKKRDKKRDDKQGHKHGARSRAGSAASSPAKPSKPTSKVAAKSPAETVRKLMKAGKVKKKCCRSSSRCKRCPVLALRRAKADLRHAELRKAA